MSASHSGKKWPFITGRMGTRVRVCTCVCVCVNVTSLLHETIRLSVCLHICFFIADVCIPVAWIGLCVCVCVCVQLNRLASMWGSKSIIPAAFTYHFTELYVQCKQRLSLHANEPVSRSLHKDSIHPERCALPAHWIWYPRLQAYSQALCSASLSLTLHGGSLQTPFCK